MKSRAFVHKRFNEFLKYKVNTAHESCLIKKVYNEKKQELWEISTKRQEILEKLKGKP